MAYKIELDVKLGNDTHPVIASDLSTNFIFLAGLWEPAEPASKPASCWNGFPAASCVKQAEERVVHISGKKAVSPMIFLKVVKCKVSDMF